MIREIASMTSKNYTLSHNFIPLRNVLWMAQQFMLHILILHRKKSWHTTMHVIGQYIFFFGTSRCQKILKLSKYYLGLSDDLDSNFFPQQTMTIATRYLYSIHICLKKYRICAVKHFDGTKQLDLRFFNFPSAYKKVGQNRNSNLPKENIYIV